MPFKIVDTVRNKVIQEFETKELAEKALERMSVLDDNVVELQSISARKKTTKKVKANVEKPE